MPHDSPPPPEALSLYEKRVDAIQQLLQSPARPDTRALIRDLQECLKGVDYDREAYYDRWIVEIRDRLVSAGVIDGAELARRVAALRAGAGDAP